MSLSPSASTTITVVPGGTTEELQAVFMAANPNSPMTISILMIVFFMLLSSV
jgi:hypothetical protein